MTVLAITCHHNQTDSLIHTRGFLQCRICLRGCLQRTLTTLWQPCWPCKLWVSQFRGSLDSIKMRQAQEVLVEGQGKVRWEEGDAEITIPKGSVHAVTAASLSMARIPSMCPRVLSTSMIPPTRPLWSELKAPQRAFDLNRVVVTSSLEAIGAEAVVEGNLATGGDPVERLAAVAGVPSSPLTAQISTAQRQPSSSRIYQKRSFQRKLFGHFSLSLVKSVT